MRHGSSIDPPNRFERLHLEREPGEPAGNDEDGHGLPRRELEYIEDQAQSIVASNDSPDLPFRYSLNPYRGCVHACAYCYARPTHEYLGFNAGLDFETRIVVKKQAARLFEVFLRKPGWKAEPISFSGVTDCYQPVERDLRLTRGCLEVARRFRQPVSIITKNALILRDLDLLASIARENLVHVYLSLTTLRPDLAAMMEPRTSIPEARLRAIRELSAASVPTGAMVAPVIPGLNDSEIPQILQAVSQAGATTAGYVLIRLPSTVRPVFEEWLQRTHPAEADKVLDRIRQTRQGKSSDSTFGQRLTGTGELADQIGNLFQVFRRQYGLDEKLPPHDRSRFRPPPDHSDQRLLF